MFWKTPKRDQVAAATGDEASLGNILVKLGYATHEQIQAAIERQLMTAPPLGQILLEMGIITEAQLEDALYQQRKARGEVSRADEVQRHLTQQSLRIKEVSADLNEIAGISNLLAAKLSAKK